MVLGLKKVKTRKQFNEFMKIFTYWHKQGKIGSVPIFILYRARDNGELYMLADQKAIAWLIPRKRPLEFIQLKTLAVAPNELRHGYGDQMLKALIREAKKQKYTLMSTGVLIDNKPARALYKKHGFVPVAKIQTPSGIVTEELIRQL